MIMTGLSGKEIKSGGASAAGIIVRSSAMRKFAEAS
jgi:hypothetical protein